MGRIKKTSTQKTIRLSVPNNSMSLMFIREESIMKSTEMSITVMSSLKERISSMPLTFVFDKIKYTGAKFSIKIDI